MNASELEFFKTILEERKIQILKNITSLNNELDELGRCELNDEGDYASVFNDTIVEGAISKKQLEELKEIDNALAKIVAGKGKYGSCEMCGEDIGVARLKVKPHAVYCIHCREYIDKPTNGSKRNKAYA